MPETRWLLIFVLIGSFGFGWAVYTASDPIGATDNLGSHAMGYLLIVGGLTFSSIIRKNNIESFLLTIMLFLIMVPILYAAIYYTIGVRSLCVLNGDEVEIKNTAHYFYFSYTTLTTLGYGDLRPADGCKFLAMSEAVIGYLLLAVTGAKLFAFISDRRIMDKALNPKRKNNRYQLRRQKKQAMKIK